MEFDVKYKRNGEIVVVRVPASSALEAAKRLVTQVPTHEFRQLFAIEMVEPESSCSSVGNWI